MNQIIKFRVWDTFQNRMYYPDGQIGLCNNEFNYPELYQNFQVPDEKYWSSNGFIDKIENKLIVQQFIGRKDDFGIEIYEGDIIEYSEGVELGDYQVLRALVKFDDYFAAFGLAPDLDADCWNYFSDGAIKGLKVIGNIFENPELLKCQSN